MNFVTVCAQLREDPREAFTGATNTVMRCKITLPPYGKKAPTDLELTIYGEKQGNRFRAMKKGMGVYIHGLSFNTMCSPRRSHCTVGNPVDVEQFPILNNVILSGRCVKDINPEDTAVQTTKPMIKTKLSVVAKGRDKPVQLLRHQWFRRASSLQLIADYLKTLV